MHLSVWCCMIEGGQALRAGRPATDSIAFSIGFVGDRIVMTIHDALWVEAAKEATSAVRHLMRRMMTTSAKLRVPLDVDIT